MDILLKLSYNLAAQNIIYAQHIFTICSHLQLQG
jgi:hypothetical protein